jgi:hypothetical protein
VSTKRAKVGLDPDAVVDAVEDAAVLDAELDPGSAFTQPRSARAKRDAGRGKGEEGREAR